MAKWYWVVVPKYYDRWSLALSPRAPQKGKFYGLGAAWIKRINRLGMMDGRDQLVKEGRIIFRTDNVKLAVVVAEVLNRRQQS